MFKSGKSEDTMENVRRKQSITQLTEVGCFKLQQAMSPLVH